MKYKILIVDDEESGRKTLQILLPKLFWAYIENISLAKDYKSASEKLIKEKFDIVFLDINLNGKSSFDLIAQIPQQPKIIFVTAYSEFMLQALREKAFDYLVKPVKEDELKNCLERITKDQQENDLQNSILIKSKGITRIITFNDILYIEGDGPYSIFHLKDEKIKTAKTLKSILPDLHKNFVRVHKSYVVNRTYIKGFTMDKLTLYNEKCLPVSRTGFKTLLQP